MKKIIFLTGASGAGKTSLLAALGDAVADSSIKILHFDAIGVPSEEEMIREYGSGAEWQKAMFEQWLERINQIETDHKFVILEGQVNLAFIKAACEKFRLTNYSIVLLHCDDATRHHRLKELRDQPELVNATMDNWSNYLLQQSKEFNAHILNTSNLTIEQAITLFKENILMIDPHDRLRKNF